MSRLDKTFEIITITFNNNEGLKKTAQSIFEQNNSDIIWTIIDAGRSHLVQQLCSKNFCKVRFFNDKGNGIYDAMNIGLSNASGDYLMFLNAGDTLENKWRVLDFLDNSNYNQFDIF